MENINAQENTNDNIKVKKCGKKTEVYTRVCGFFRPVSNYNNGKAQEFKDRHSYNN